MYVFYWFAQSVECTTQSRKYMYMYTYMRFVVDYTIDRLCVYRLYILTGCGNGERLTPGSMFGASADSDVVPVCGQGAEACGHTVH